MPYRVTRHSNYTQSFSEHPCTLWVMPQILQTILRIQQSYRGAQITEGSSLNIHKHYGFFPEFTDNLKMVLL